MAGGLPAAEDYDESLKVLLVGDSGIDFKEKIIRVKGKKVKLQIWDTAGQERFRTITTSYFRGAHGVLMIYDGTDRVSFDNVSVWIEQLKSGTENAAMVLVGNKADCVEETTVSEEEGRAMGKEFGVPFFPCSAKDGTNVEEIFAKLAEAALERVEKGEIGSADSGGGGVAVGSAPTADKRGCC